MSSQIKLKLKVEVKDQEPVEIELSLEDAKGLYEALKVLVGEKDPCYISYVPYTPPIVYPQPWVPPYTTPYRPWQPYWLSNTTQVTLEYSYE
jgi:hypothetical protein